MRTWITRNAVALVVIVVAAPALVGILLGLPLLEASNDAADPIEVAEGESVEVAGYTWTLVASGEFPHAADNAAVPAGLAVTAAIIEVRPTDDPDENTCDAELTSRSGGAERRWLTLNDPLQFDYGVAEHSTTICQLDGEPFQYEVIYLTPEGTISESTIDVEIGVVDVELIRFALTD